MKIAYCSASVIPSRSANSIHVMNMCYSLSSSHQVTLYHRKGTEIRKNIYKYYDVDENFKMKSSHWPNIPFGGLFYGILNSFDSRKHDIIYCRDFYSALISSILFRKSVVYESHQIPKSNVKKNIEIMMIKKSSLIMLVVISNALKNDYEKLLKSSKKIIVSHDGAPVLIKDKPQIKDKKVDHIGYIGHLYEGRGIELIIELSKRFKNLTFHVIGGTDNDLERYKRQFEKENLIFHGFIEQEKIKKLVLSFDVLLAPYQYKVSVHGGKGDTSRWMSPLKIFEYMSSCKPIICSDLPVLREILEDNKNAILCKPDNIEEWESALNTLIHDVNLRKRLSVNAYDDFIKNYTWKIRSRKIIEEINNRN